MGGLLKELSHGQAGERGPDERRGTLLELLKVSREDSLVVWEEHFKTMLLLLLETLGDKDVRRPSLHLPPPPQVAGVSYPIPPPPPPPSSGSTPSELWRCVS